MFGPIDKIFWMRLGFAVLAGLISGAMGYLSFNKEAINGIWVAFMIYFASYIVGKVTIGRQLPPSDQKKIVTTGMGGYIFMFLFIWILYNTITFGQQAG